jgi:DNA-binding transcriptional ArsR family regulator
VPEDEQSLPAELSATLAPHLHHALNSPARRRILRALNATTDAQTLEDLREVVPAASISTLGYHVLVLEMAGCVSAASQIVRTNGMLQAYASNIKDSQMVVDLLRATEREDEAPDD